MATTAIATMQAVWDCRWSRLGQRLTGVPEALQPESTWVCVREGERRNVCEEECLTCPYWEMEPAESTGGVALQIPIAVASVRAAAEAARPVPAPFPWAVRFVLAAIVITFVATGVVILDSPLAIPFTVALWLSAAAAAGVAVFGRLTEH
jgi:hypothetical protein